jgi:Ca2+-binding RTX toxin-like protein
MESLEDRQLLAAALTVTFDYADGLGILHIEGTDQADTVVVRQANGWISVDGAKLNGSYSAVSASYVHAIDVNTLGGDDRVLLNSEVNYWQQPIRALSIVDAGTGNDQIVGLAGPNLLNGGEGNDVVVGNNGHDVLLGGAGSDLLYGLGGDDILDGGEASDALLGGAGMDILLGGADADYLFGEGDDDFLFCDAWDLILGRVDGGAGNNKPVLNATTAHFQEAVFTQIADMTYLDRLKGTVDAAAADIANYSGGSVFNAHSGVESLLGPNEGAFAVIHNYATKRGFGPTGLALQTPIALNANSPV